MILVRTVLAFLAGLAGLAVTLVIAVITAPFWLVSRLTSWVAGFLEPKSVPQSDVIEYDAALGWKGKANQRCHVQDESGEAHLVTTDADGWRGSGPVEDAGIVVFGDSFAFGDAIGDDEFFANRGRGVTIKAVGAPGYNMVQCLMLMERLAPRLAGKTVVWLVYLGNDLADNLKPEMDGYRTPFLRRPPGGGDWEVARDHVSPERWRFQTRLRAHELFMEICVGAHLADRAFDAFDHLVGAAQAVLSPVGARLVVVSVPDLSRLSQRRFEQAVRERPDLAAWDPDLPDRRMGAICTERGVPYVALSEHLTTANYRTHDVHWNASGNDVVARLLSELPTDGPGTAGPKVTAPGEPSRAAG